jgi:hypothetical protein
MSNRDLATGVFRAWGVVWSVHVLIALPQLLNVLLRHSSQWTDKGMETYVQSSQVISVGCQIIVAVTLLSKAGWLASLVFPDEQQLHLVFNAADLRTTLFAVVGLYFLVDGLSHAVGSAYQLVTRPRGDSQNAFEYLWQREPENLTRSLGSSIAGAFVFFGLARGRGLLSTIRDAYREKLSLEEPRDEE